MIGRQVEKFTHVNECLIEKTSDQACLSYDRRVAQVRMKLRVVWNELTLILA